MNKQEYESMRGMLMCRVQTGIWPHGLSDLMDLDLKYIHALEIDNERLKRLNENSVSKMELDTCRSLNKALRERDARQESIIRSYQDDADDANRRYITWHKYPDTKPEPSYEHEVNIPIIIQYRSGAVSFGEYNVNSGNIWSYGQKANDVVAFAYLPEGCKI